MKTLKTRLIASRLIISGLIISSLLISCQESEEGCLDLLSNNFNFMAVSECDSCCTYPNMNFNFRVDYDTLLSRALIDTFFLDNNDSLILHEIKLAISGFVFDGPERSYRVLDSVQAGQLFLKDDYVFSDRTTTYTIGQIRYAGRTDSIKFSLGIASSDIESWGSLNDINQNSQLDRLLDSMYVEERQQMAMMRLRVQIQDSIRDITISSNDAIDLSFPVEKFNAAAEACAFNLRIDFSKLTRGLSSSLSNSEIEEHILDRIDNSIKIE